MKAAYAILTLLSTVIMLPIWYYLLYQILKRVDATDVMFLLYWIYLPLGFVLQITANLLKASK